MKKVLLSVLLVVLSVSAAFAGATEDLFVAVEDEITSEALQGFLKAGADLKAKNEEGKTVLIFAAGFKNNPETFQTLIDAGSDVNAKTIRAGLL